MNNALFFMALAGTIPLLIYLFLRYVMHYHYRSPEQMYLLLKLSLLLYLLPLPLKANQIKEFLRQMFHDKTLFTDMYSETPVKLDTGKYIQVLSNGSFRPPTYSKIFLLLACIWIIVFFFLAVRYIFHYRKIRKELLKYAVPTPREFEQLAEKVKETLSVRRKLHILTLNADFSPFTLGVCKPILIVPRNISAEKLYPILLHECTHIKALDSLTGFFSVLAAALHWYLPFSYILSHELKQMSELNCDNKVSRHMDTDEIKRYGNTIIQMNRSSEQTFISDSPFVSNFKSNSIKLTKERLIMLKNKKRKSSLFVAACTAMSLLISTTAMAAYEVPSFFVGAPDDFYLNDGEIYMDFSSDQSLLLPENEKYFSQADIVFISDDGDVFFPEQTSHSPRPQAACQHTYQPGTASKHIPHSSGGCTVYQYRAKRCSKCGLVVYLDIINIPVYFLCPH